MLVKTSKKSAERMFQDGVGVVLMSNVTGKVEEVRNTMERYFDKTFDEIVEAFEHELGMALFYILKTDFDDYRRTLKV